MEYIRRQKAKPDYDPNISHCLCGADADLIMLGLATHELNFTILREEFKPNQPKPCDICSQYGHEMSECKGEARDINDSTVIPCIDPGFILSRLNVLREYLENECENLDLERFIDDFVFLCFFVGNDFLPHLPSLEIREGAIDRLVRIYKSTISEDKSSSPYLTENGFVNLNHVQKVFRQLGEVEDEIFRTRQFKNKQYRKRMKQQKTQKQADIAKTLESPWTQPQAIVPRGERPDAICNPRLEAANVRLIANEAASKILKSMLIEEGSKLTKSQNEISVKEEEKVDKKRKYEDDSDSDIDDDVKLGTEGWKERYYFHKFEASDYKSISCLVTKEYVIGLCWVLRYYYQGCPDWQWFYPFHYAPFASDFSDIASIKIDFDKNSKPFKPLEQLMGVFPAESSQNLPLTWQNLMKDPSSSIIDFYPTNFKIDLNGKTQAWQGVALLPFIDENRLHKAISSVYGDLNEEEKERNSLGPHLMFISYRKNEIYLSTNKLFNNEATELDLNPDSCNGMNGQLRFSRKYSKLHKNSRCVEYYDPIYQDNFIFPAIRLKKAIPPPKVLKTKNEPLADWRPMIGMSHLNQKASLGVAGHRIINHYVDNYSSSQSYPRSYERYSQRPYNRGNHHSSYQSQNRY